MMHRSFVSIGLLALTLLSCKKSNDNTGGQPDATTGGGAVDAKVGDAPIADLPDAMVSAGNPDAKVSGGNPDAMVSGGNPDAMVVVVPDAKVPDAPVSLPDAPLPDAMVSQAADANTGSGMCLPQCWIDITGGLLAPCVPSGSCTLNVVDSSVVTCFANGVKFVSMSSPPDATITWKKSNGDVCFSIVSTNTTQTSTTLKYKNAAGTVVATETIPDTSKSVHDYQCGASAPVSVDLDGPACQAERDGGTSAPDGGMGCSFSASCQP